MSYFPKQRILEFSLRRELLPVVAMLIGHRQYVEQLNMNYQLIT